MTSASQSIESGAVNSEEYWEQNSFVSDAQIQQLLIDVLLTGQIQQQAHQQPWISFEPNKPVSSVIVVVCHELDATAIDAQKLSQLLFLSSCNKVAVRHSSEKALAASSARASSSSKTSTKCKHPPTQQHQQKQQQWRYMDVEECNALLLWLPFASVLLPRALHQVV